MANANTHIATAISVGSIFSISLIKANIINEKCAIILFTLIVIGTLIPDIDSDKEQARKHIFNWISMITSLFILIILAQYQKILISLIISVTVFVSLRYGLIYSAKHSTNRRGIFHSITMALLLSLIVITCLFNIFRYSGLVSWYGGIFFLTGYLIHLFLDELYATNLINDKIQRP
jgi:hypothetical protein